MRMKVQLDYSQEGAEEDVEIEVVTEKGVIGKKIRKLIQSFKGNSQSTKSKFCNYCG